MSCTRISECCPRIPQTQLTTGQKAVGTLVVATYAVGAFMALSATLATPAFPLVLGAVLVPPVAVIVYAIYQRTHSARPPTPPAPPAPAHTTTPPLAIPPSPSQVSISTPAAISSSKEATAPAAKKAVLSFISRLSSDVWETIIGPLDKKAPDRIQQLTLSKGKIDTLDERAIREIDEFLTNNPGIEGLALYGVYIPGELDQTMADMICKHPRLRSLTLYNNQPGATIGVIEKLPNTITQLVVTKNKIVDHKRWARALIKLQLLETLYLCYVGLDNKNAATWAKALPEMKGLTTLNLYDNELSDLKILDGLGAGGSLRRVDMRENPMYWRPVNPPELPKLDPFLFPETQSRLNALKQAGVEVIVDQSKLGPYYQPDIQVTLLEYPEKPAPTAKRDASGVDQFFNENKPSP